MAFDYNDINKMVCRRYKIMCYFSYRIRLLWFHLCCLNAYFCSFYLVQIDQHCILALLECFFCVHVRFFFCSFLFMLYFPITKLSIGCSLELAVRRKTKTLKKKQTYHTTLNVDVFCICLI